MGPAARAAEARPRRDIQVYCTTRPAVDGPTARGSMARLLHSIRTTGSLARPLPTRWPRSCIPSALPARWPDCFPARWPARWPDCFPARWPCSCIPSALPARWPDCCSTGSMARWLVLRTAGSRQWPNGPTRSAVVHSGPMAQAQLSRVAEDPLVQLVVVLPVEPLPFRVATLVVVVLLQLLVAAATLPVVLVRGDAELVVCPEHTKK